MATSLGRRLPEYDTIDASYCTDTQCLELIDVAAMAQLTNATGSTTTEIAFLHHPWFGVQRNMTKKIRLTG